MAIDLKTYREKIYNLKQGLNEIRFIDTKPNFMYITNLGSNDIFVADTPLVSPEKNYELLITKDTRRNFVRPLGITTLYIYAKNIGDVKIESGITQLSLADIPVTQIIATAGSSISVSKVDVDKIISPLPNGTNHIGEVSINGLSMALSDILTGISDIKNLITDTNTTLNDIKNLITASNVLLQAIVDKP